MRTNIGHSEIKIVDINNLCPLYCPSHMLKCDTMHGRFAAEVDSKENAIIANGQETFIFTERNSADLARRKVGAKYIVESTGPFLTKEKSRVHLTASAKKVIISALSKDCTPMFVVGINLGAYMNGIQFVSSASCTANNRTSRLLCNQMPPPVYKS